MARDFASGNELETTTGSASGMTYGTVAVLINFDAASTYQGIIYFEDSGGNFLWGVATEIANKLQWYFASASIVTTALTAGWYLIVARKATGSVTPRFSWYSYSANTWTHQPGSVTLGNGTAPGASGFLSTGYTSTSDPLTSDLAVRALWSNNLPWSADSTGDLAIEASGLPFSLQAWFAAAPSVLHLFDQSATGQKVLDLTGGGANESSIIGTSVSTASVPVFSYGGGSFEVLSVATVAGDATVTPSVVVATAAVPSPTVQTGSTAAPTAVVATASVPAPTISTGEAVQPATVVGVASVPSATIKTGETVTPSSVVAVAGIPSPTLSTGTGVSPATVVTIAGVGSPSLSTGETVQPATVSVVAAVPAPSVSTGSNATVTPSTVAGVASIPAPTRSTGSTVAPATVAGVGAVPAPSVSTSGNVTIVAATVAAVGGAASPSLSTGQRVNPVAVVAAGAVPSPTLAVETRVSPATASAVANVETPTLKTDSTVAAQVVAAYALVGAIAVGAYVPTAGKFEAQLVGQRLAGALGTGRLAGTLAPPRLDGRFDQ